MSDAKPVSSPTDIVVDTLNRLPLLQRTLEAIWERTTSPYRLHVIDDASTEGNQEYLLAMQQAGKIHSLMLRKVRKGIPANWNEVARTGDSEIVIYTNGDVLCPRVKPDWLARGLGAMSRYPDIGLLSLNGPMCTARRAWRVLSRRARVTIVDRVPSFYLFARRKLMQKIQIPGIGGSLHGIPIVADYRKIDRAWSRAAQSRGYKVGYLSHTYCQHIGLWSVRIKIDLSKWAVTPLNADTLEPPKEFAG